MTGQIRAVTQVLGAYIPMLIKDEYVRHALHGEIQKELFRGLDNSQ